MSTSVVLHAIDVEIKRLTEARRILSGNHGFAAGRRVSHGLGSGRKKRHMSAEARRRISEAQKKRWATLKRTAKK